MHICLCCAEPSRVIKAHPAAEVTSIMNLIDNIMTLETKPIVVQQIKWQMNAVKMAEQMGMKGFAGIRNNIDKDNLPADSECMY